MTIETRRLSFVDVFAGAGGLSLGLMAAGLKGIFAVEREPNAFATLKANLIDGKPGFKYDWPDGLPIEPLDMAVVLKDYSDVLRQLEGRVDVLVGGPPCQGFSSAGKRRQDDPRNRLFELYVQMANALRPRYLVFENVPGFAIPFGKGLRMERNPRQLGRPVLAFSERVARSLNDAGYDVVSFQEVAVEFGVPQRRTRHVMLGIRRDLGHSISAEHLKVMLAVERDEMLTELGLTWPVSLAEAISDLETVGHPMTACPDSSGFDQVIYSGPKSRYQIVMHDGMADGDAPNSMRLANHRPETIERFKGMLASCRKGVRVSLAERERFGSGKASITPLAPDTPSHTITSLPDDFIHYCEPRVLTVREYARIQSFPDWFEFHGKYTTGQLRRRTEVPRYTQVANAVPPLFARAFGRVLVQIERSMVTESTGPSTERAAVGRDVVLAGSA